MAKQQGGEFASTDPTTRAQNARVQERRVSTEVSLFSRSSPQHLQRSTPSHFSNHALSLQSLGHADVARSRLRGVISEVYSDEVASNFQQRDNAVIRPWTGGIDLGWALHLEGFRSRAVTATQSIQGGAPSDGNRYHCAAMAFGSRCTRCRSTGRSSCGR